eukprot:Skav224099  [mRNA]  locus=scaffold4565:134127:136147:- [translate_table: standard]
MAPAPALGGTGLAGGTTGSGLGMPGLQGTGLDAQGDKGFVKLSTDPATLHQAFHYADIAAYLLQRPEPRSPEECREQCSRNESCAAWEVCAPLGDGCDGCYLISRAPRRWDQREGWHAEILSGREELGWQDNTGDLANLTVESCREFLLSANGSLPSTSRDLLVRIADECQCQCFFMQSTFLVGNIWEPKM